MDEHNEYTAIFEDLYFKSVAVVEKIITPTNLTEECVKSNSCMKKSNADS